MSSVSITEAIVLDAGPDIPIIDADEFIQDFLPHVPGTDAVVGRIVSWIENCPKYYAQRRWKKFAQDPDKYKQREPAVFSRLADVFNAITEAVAEIMPELEATRSTAYVEKPTKSPETVFQRDLSRPDAYFLFRERFSADAKNPHWMDIAVAGEFKKKNNSETVESDITQVLWDMHEMMREDPRRRRCFGFTIENRDFRMYSTTRSEIVVSRVVDFLSSPRHIIKFFFALMYSSEEALGRDMSMTPIWNGNAHITPQYDILVHTQESELAPVIVKTFRTVKLLSGIGAETIRGRGTRVWEVYKVEDGQVDDSHTYVLKDAWVDSDRTCEGEVLAEIRKDAKQLLDVKEMNAFLSCLLKTAYHGNVLLSDEALDCTISGRKRRRHIVNNDERLTLTLYSAPPRLKSTSASSGPRKRRGERGGELRTPGDHHEATDDVKGTAKALLYDAKTHYRIVFEEVCEVLHEIKSVRRIVTTLWKACAALETLHKLGWVHRDISSGNIMVCGKLVKITDFEYAKKMTLPGKVHEIRTGTEDFMAIEVRDQEFRFVPFGKERLGKIVDEDPFSVDTDELLDDASEAEPEHGELTIPTYTWFYNPLHDLESIFWLTLYFTGNKDIVLGPSVECKKPYTFVQETEAEHRDRILAHWNFGLTLFSSRNGRFDVIEKNALRRHLSRHPLHPAIAPLGDILCRLRYSLVDRYFEIERNPAAIHHHSAGTLHKTYKSLLREAVIHLQNVPFDVQVQSLRGAIEALPKSYQTIRADKRANSIKANAPTRSKRARDVGESDEPPSKSPRVSLDQKSPSRTALQDASPHDETPAAAATEATPGVLLPPTRVLRSHSRKAAAKTSPPSPRPAARARNAVTSKPRKGKATKRHEAVKAAAKVAATKVNNKTRKGR